jgi:hypothetical protein
MRVSSEPAGPAVVAGQPPGPGEDSFSSGPPSELQTTAVPGGPVAYRHQIRTFGPFMALVPPGVALISAALLWRLYPCSGTSCVSSGAAGWVLAALALPTSLVVGMPWEGGGSRYALMGVTSALIWITLGWIAAKRATRSPVASWRDWWREYAWLLLGVWAGVLAALAILAYVVQHNTFL